MRPVGTTQEIFPVLPDFNPNVIKSKNILNPGPKSWGFLHYYMCMAKDKENQKQLAKEWYERNKALTIERSRLWALANPEKKHAAHRKNREKDLEAHNARNREWNKNNKPVKAALECKRRASQLQRTPKWDPNAHLIIAKYQLAAMLTKASGIEHHVDHIIPLQGKKVSGLHTFANLRVIPGSDNVKKSNSFTV